MTNCTQLDQTCRTPEDCALFGCKAMNEWPKCAVPACQNKCCRALRSRYCWPHTPGDALTAQQNLMETEIRGREDVRAL